MTKSSTRYSVFNAELKPPQKIKAVYDDGEFVIHGQTPDDKTVFSITFEYILLSRICPESVRLKLVHETQNCVGFILVDQESELVSWLSEQDLQITDMRNFKHYIFFIGNEVVDVVAQGVPHIKYM